LGLGLGLFMWNCGFGGRIRDFVLALWNCGFGGRIRDSGIVDFVAHLWSIAAEGKTISSWRYVLL